MLASWAPKTQAAYNSHLKQWKEFCTRKEINPFEADFRQAMDFIEFLFNVKKASYGYIAATRSALSAILPKRNAISFGKCPDVSRMIKGIFKLRPSLPKHTVVYDANLVLNYMKSLPEDNALDLEMLTKKLATLLCFLSGQRAQTITALSLEFCHREKLSVTFYIASILKNTRPGKHQQPLVFQKFEESKICVLECLNEYIRRTELIRENLPNQPKQLILSYAYPHKPVTTPTITRYVKMFLELAGIDITVFTCHSTRKASTSKANNLGLSLKDINRAAGWFSSSTFVKHYNLHIVNNFGKTLQQGTALPTD